MKHKWIWGFASRKPFSKEEKNQTSQGSHVEHWLQVQGVVTCYVLPGYMSAAAAAAAAAAASTLSSSHSLTHSLTFSTVDCQNRPAVQQLNTHTHTHTPSYTHTHTHLHTHLHSAALENPEEDVHILVICWWRRTKQTHEASFISMHLYSISVLQSLLSSYISMRGLLYLNKYMNKFTKSMFLVFFEDFNVVLIFLLG